jgi:sirohydrochlorin cobaltochelatase
MGGLQKMNGIILFAHGSRDPLWSKPIEAIAHAIATKAPSTQVRCAYLELMQPDLAAVVAELAGQGIGQMRIIPMFLGVGKHAREDLPVLVQALRLAYPAIAFDLTPSIGEHPELINAIANIVTEKENKRFIAQHL